jgi:hypothetical protein
MNWFKKFDRRMKQPVTQGPAIGTAVAQIPVGVTPLFDLEKKIAEGVKAAMYSAKYKDVNAKLDALLTTYVPKGPRYKIRQHPEGGNIILQLKVVHKNVSDASTKYDVYNRKLLPTLTDLEAFDPTPVEKYVSIRMTDDYGKMIERRFDSLTLAEYYLYRLADPEMFETCYDGDPLKRL